ncbi:hypothetical protein FOA52_006018 [Chlamydomonas sp. UWO 241]|nr:hypothetical protein FOA52_006018 [Chlamydomonas sp. UWO 241]
MAGDGPQPPSVALIPRLGLGPHLPLPRRSVGDLEASSSDAHEHAAAVDALIADGDAMAAVAAVLRRTNMRSLRPRSATLAAAGQLRKDDPVVQALTQQAPGILTHTFPDLAATPGGAAAAAPRPRTMHTPVQQQQQQQQQQQLHAGQQQPHAQAAGGGGGGAGGIMEDHMLAVSSPRPANPAGGGGGAVGSKRGEREHEPTAVVAPPEPGTKRQRRTTTGAHTSTPGGAGVEFTRPLVAPEEAAAKLRASLEALLAGDAEVAADEDVEMEDAEEGGSGTSADEEGDADADAGGSGRGARAGGLGGGERAGLDAAATRSACEQLLAGREAGVLALLPLPLLQTLLAQLTRGMGGGARALDARSTPEQVARVCASLDAAIGALLLLSAPGMPPQVYQEEVVSQALSVLKHALQHNVLPLLDARLARQWRPSLLDNPAATGGVEPGSSPVRGGRGRGRATAGRGGRGARGGDGAASAAASGAPAFVSQLVARCERCADLLGEALSRAHVADAQSLLPLLRVALQTLTVDGLQTVQLACSRLAVAAFKALPGMRQPLLDELVGAVMLPGLAPSSGSGTKAGASVRRHMLVQGVEPGSTVAIQVVVGLIMQLVTAAADLPPVDAGAKAAYERCGLPLAWGERFWGALMDKLPTAKAVKSDSCTDVKALVEAIIQDLLAVQHLPEWPSAPLLLLLPLLLQLPLLLPCRYA